MNETSLLDLPDELLKLIGAGSTGQGVASLSCCSKRLRAVAKHLQGSPIMCSAMSTDHDLYAAIKDATNRAMAGSWGAVDFALIFVANYGLPKKYTDPGDASHAVDMLRQVLGKDIPIVGCACSGIMGIGPDSQPLEVDPAMSQRRRKQSGKGAAAPLRGVTVLLGKVPPGCSVRAFASAEEAPAPDAAWADFDEALSLTSSQRTQLAGELAAEAAPTIAATTAAGSGPAAAEGSRGAGKADGPASPSAAAAATSLLAVAAGEASSRSAAAGSSAAAAGALYHTGYGDVQAELVPQLCLLLYRSIYHGSEALGSTLEWMQAHHPGMRVMGGASSGAGDLLFSAGAVNRLASDPPTSPAFIGLLVCSASSNQAAAAAAEAPAPATAAAALAASRSTARPSSSVLPVACFSAYGLAPAPKSCVYSDVSADLGWLPGFCELSITAATQVLDTAAAAAADTGSSRVGSGRCGDPGTAGVSSSSGAVAPVWRSQRQQQQQQQPAAAAAPAGDAAGVSGLQQLYETITSDAIIELGHGDELFVALWRCAAADLPGHFSGTEDELLILQASSFREVEAGADIHRVALMMYTERNGQLGASPGAADAGQWVLQHSVWQPRPGSKLCMQLLVNSGEGSRLAISQGLSRVREELRLGGAEPADGSGSMADCYAAAAANARQAGARSGLCGQAVFSCTGRGQALYHKQRADGVHNCHADEQAAGGEAALLDDAWAQACPFVGVYCDGELGPPVEHGCLGWAEAGSSMPNAFTSMLAAFGFRST